MMVLTWMQPLMYLCDGHIVYECSFLVDLDISESIDAVGFSVSGSYITNMGLLSFLQRIFPGK